MTTPTLADVLL